MKKKILGLMFGFLLIGVNLFAADGDLIVNGNVGIGTTTNTTSKLLVKGSSGTSGAIQIDTNGQSQLEFLINGVQKWALVSNGNDIALYQWPGLLPFYMSSAGNLGIGYNNPFYKLHVNGSFAATTKNFDIPDPRFNDESQRLVHSSLEGPEVGVYYRGEDRLKDGKAVVELPGYFEALTKKEGRTVLLTPKFETDDKSVSNLAASAVVDGKFSVMAVDSFNLGQRFYWEIKAVRADVETLQVEQKDKKYHDKDKWKPEKE